MNPDLDRKISDVFASGVVIIKKSLVDITRDQFRKLPRFVLDYLVATFVDETDPGPGLRRIDVLLREHFVESDQRELVKYRLQKSGRYKVFGRVQVRVDQGVGGDVFWVSVPSLGDDRVRIEPTLLERYGQSLLTTGSWGTIDLVYDPSVAVSRRRIAPYLIVDFTPQQIIEIDVDEYCAKREAFSAEEWIDLLMASIGFEPTRLDGEAKVAHLCRLIPFVEPGVNLIELGPRETGKTYAARSLSSYGHVVTGSSISIPTLFYNKARRVPGIITTRDVVCFDEISGADFRGRGEVVNMLKDVMNSGHFSRDDREFTTGCGVCFTGNIRCDTGRRAVAGYHRHLFAGLPREIGGDSAFLDRIHGFIPGWVVPKITPESMTDGNGFIADYFSEIMHRLRDRSFSSVFASRVRFGPMTQRSQLAIKRMASGLMKLVFPHRDVDSLERSEIEWCLGIAVGLRQRVLDQLAVIESGEFGGQRLIAAPVGERRVGDAALNDTVGARHGEDGLGCGGGHRGPEVHRPAMGSTCSQAEELRGPGRPGCRVGGPSGRSAE